MFGVVSYNVWCFQALECFFGLGRNPYRSTVLSDPYGHDASPGHDHRSGLSISRVSPRLLEHHHARPPKTLGPRPYPEPVSEENLAHIIDLDTDNMDRPMPSREYVVSKTTVGEDFETRLLEIIEVDRVIDVPEGV